MPERSLLSTHQQRALMGEQGAALSIHAGDLRAVCNHTKLLAPEGHDMAMIKIGRATTGLAAFAILAAMAAALTGCAEQPYPDLGTINKVDNVLTPGQRDDAIKDLAREQNSSGTRQ
jgi:hypothetical protein